MKKFLELYEEEVTKDEMDIDSFKETLQKLKDVFNNAEPPQTAAIILVDIIEKTVDESDDQQTLIDSFKEQIESALESLDTEDKEAGEGEESPIDFEEKFDEMNDIEIGDDGEELEDTGEKSTDNEEDDAHYMLDDVESNSKEEKFSNLKKVTAAKKSPKKDEEPAEE